MFKKDIPGHLGYQITKEGKVYSLKRKRFLSLRIDKYGYQCASLTQGDGKSISRFVHRLVAITYIDNPNDYEQVNHLDGNKLNNHVDNLEWCNQLYNNNYTIKAGRRPKQYKKCSL